jgi:hypothetical protein
LPAKANADPVRNDVGSILERLRDSIYIGFRRARRATDQRLQQINNDLLETLRPRLRLIASSNPADRRLTCARPLSAGGGKPMIINLKKPCWLPGLDSNQRPFD